MDMAFSQGVGPLRLRARFTRSISSPARRNLQRSQPASSARGAALGLGACTVRTLVVMDVALFEGVAGKVQLDSGLALKLKSAPCVSHSVPMGSHVGNGMLWATR